MVCQKCKEARDALKRAASSVASGNAREAGSQIAKAATLVMDKDKESSRIRRLVAAAWMDTLGCYRGR